VALALEHRTHGHSLCPASGQRLGVCSLAFDSQVALQTENICIRLGFIKFLEKFKKFRSLNLFLLIIFKVHNHLYKKRVALAINHTLLSIKVMIPQSQNKLYFFVWNRLPLENLEIDVDVKMRQIITLELSLALIVRGKPQRN